MSIRFSVVALAIVVGFVASQALTSALVNAESTDSPELMVRSDDNLEAVTASEVETAWTRRGGHTVCQGPGDNRGYIRCGRGCPNGHRFISWNPAEHPSCRGRGADEQ